MPPAHPPGNPEHHRRQQGDPRELDHGSDARGFFIDRESGGDEVFGVFLGEAVVGGSGLHRRSGPDTLEIGYWIHVDHIGQGFATEAAGALTTRAFEDPAIAFVEIHHDRANTASAGVPRKLGFELVAERPDAIEAPGEVGIDCCWRIARDDWKPEPT